MVSSVSTDLWTGYQNASAVHPAGRPVYANPDAQADEHAFETRHLAHEFRIPARLGEAHHAVHACATIVPAAVIEDHRACGQQMLDVAFEVPPAALIIRGFVQRHDIGRPGVQMFGKAFDRTGLACRIAPLEEQHEFLTCPFRLKLHLHKLCLLALTAAARQPPVLWTILRKCFLWHSTAPLLGFLPFSQMDPSLRLDSNL